MKIIYTSHARQRMADIDRNISKSEVEAAISDPDIRRPGRGRVLIADKRIAKRKVSVVYREDENSIMSLLQKAPTMLP